MCIRDRYERGDGARAEWLGPNPTKLQVRFVVIVSDRLGSCLLYTSDAADERSSVDLGGRRIIKKKKTERQMRGA